MPRVALTAEQRQKQALTSRAKRLAEGLWLYKRRERLTLKELGKAVGIGDKFMARVLDGDYEVRLPIEVLWKLEALSKMALEKSEESNV